MNRRFSASVITVALLTSALVMLVPAATASHGCEPVVRVDPSHTPGGVWSNHSSPLFYWWSYCSSVSHYNVHVWSTGSTFSTAGTSWHPGLPDGSHYIAVQTIWTWLHYHIWDHCHPSWAGCSWHRHYDPHWHYEESHWVNSPVVYIDTVRPVASLEWGTPRVDDDASWVTSTTPFSVTATDERSGVASTTAAIDGAVVAPSGFSIPAGDGARTLTYGAQDQAQNHALTSGVSVIVDDTPPVTSIDATPPKFFDASNTLWVRNITAFTLEAADAGVGVQGITYAVNDALPQPYAGEFFLPEGAQDGEHTITFWATDRLGNVEVARTVTVRLDNTVPEHRLVSQSPQSLTVAAASAEPCTADPARIDGKPAADAATGAGPGLPTAPELPEAPVLPETPALPDAPATPPTMPSDAAAGACAGQFARTERVNATLPAAPDGTPELPESPEQPAAAPEEVEIPAQSVGHATLQVVGAQVTVRVNATDFGSGVSHVAFTVDGVLRHSDEVADYEWSWDTSGEIAGEHTLEIRTFDNIGNEAEPIFVTVTIVPTSARGAVATLEARTGEDLPDVPELPEAPALPGVPSVPTP